jgi:hypothetical protein
VAPPNLHAPDAPQKVEEVAQFMGLERGFGRMTTDQQEPYLMQAYTVYGTKATPELRAKFIAQMNQMSSGQREVLNNAIFEIGRKHMMRHAQEYASLPPYQRSQYVTKAITDFDRLRDALSGKSAGDSLTEPLKKDLPSSSDELMKVVVDRTDGKERAQAKPFIDAMATKYQEKRKNSATAKKRG